MKGEKGVTLTGLVIYVLFFTAVLVLVVNLSNYIFINLGEVNSNSMSSEEFNKFNTNFIKDVKASREATVSTNSGNVTIIFSNGTNYNYIFNEKAIYKNYEKIADNICKFSATRTTKNSKNVIKIVIGTGKYLSKPNYGKTINYVLKYW